MSEAALRCEGAYEEYAKAHRSTRVLIFGTSYIDTQERRWLAEQWLRLVRAVNPGISVAVIDTPGPVDWRPPTDWDFRFVDNIGHLTATGRDGWGRAFVEGLRQADAIGYDYAIHIECDLLFARQVMPVIERMRRHGIKAVSTVAAPHRFIETGLLFLDMEYVRDSRLVERYHWQTSSLQALPEQRMEALLGDDLFLMPWWGVRDDDKLLTPGTMTAHFPVRMDWLTHATVPCYRRFLEMNGVLG